MDIPTEEEESPLTLPALSAKTSHPVEVAEKVSKDALVTTALKMWHIVKGDIDSDDGLYKALNTHLDTALTDARTVRDDLDVSIEKFEGKLAGIRGLLPTEEVRSIARQELTKVQAEILSSDGVMDALYFASLITHADGQISALGLARWAHNGFPQVTMGHKFCAAMLCTGMSEDTLEFVKAPWNAFFIEVPDGMLTLNSKQVGRDVQVRRILVTRIRNVHKGEVWAYVAFTDSFMTLWRFGVTTAELLPPVLEHATYMSADPTSEGLTDQDERVSTLVGRLIINTCLAMSNENIVKPIGPGHKVHGKNWNKRNEREPVVRTFQIGRPVNLDLRETVRQFISGDKGTAPSVQTLVRGHYKTQRHGPKNSRVKVIWREPFWRGPEDAPILTRPHHFDKE